MTSMINWYRAIVRHQPKFPKDKHIHVPTLMLWDVKDIALCREMVKPSIELCDDAQLIFFKHATHWVQHEEAKQVNDLLIEFFS
jgi:pimeloyl-ACP methyl ester carboxylesterase